MAATSPRDSAEVPGNPPGRIAILDDDPTGVQTLGGVRVLLEWTPDIMVEAAAGDRPIHLLTNSRAFVPDEARSLVRSAAAAIGSALPGASIVLRGDSTLRGHLLEEYLAVAEVTNTRKHPPLLLAPALPSAGRVTIGGIQYLERGGKRVPVHLTEFAKDGPFSYSSSRLLEWAEERSRGLFKAVEGIEIALEAIRQRGPDVVVEAISNAARRDSPVAVVADSETVDDIATVAEGYRRASALRRNVILRCGPALAGALANASATALAPMPSASEVLLVSGSYVPQSVRQLADVRARFPTAVSEVDPIVLASGSAEQLTSISEQVSAQLDATGLAVLAISATRPPHLADLATGLTIARRLAEIVKHLNRPQTLAVLKGGVTSAVTLRIGLGARQADIVGPVLPGVALWQIIDPSPRTALVVPGNVGDDDLLVRILELIRQKPT